MKLSSEVDLEIVARGTTGFSGETEKPCYTVHAHLYNNMYVSKNVFVYTNILIPIVYLP